MKFKLMLTTFSFFTLIVGSEIKNNPAAVDFNVIKDSAKMAWNYSWAPSLVGALHYLHTSPSIQQLKIKKQYSKILKKGIGRYAGLQTALGVSISFPSYLWITLIEEIKKDHLKQD